MALGINILFKVISIYIPLSLYSFGYKQGVIGLVMAFSILPLIIFERIVGSRASKKGVRTCMIIGYGYLSICLALYALVSSWPALFICLFLTTYIGAACIEPLQETYFFEVVPKKDTNRFYGIYDTADPLSSIAGPLMASCLFAYFGYNGIWMAVSVCMFVFFLIAISIKKKY